MMRALAVVAAAVVVLVALPTTAGATVESRVEAVADTQAVRGVVGFLAQPWILGLSVGAVIWLSVALFAGLVATVAVGRSRHSGTAGRAGATADHVRTDVAVVSR